MIRLGLECAFVFLLPTLLYFGYRFVMSETADPAAAQQSPSVAEILDAAPLAWLFVFGCVLLTGTLLAFATLQEQNIDKPYEPAVYKDGHIVQGHSK